MFGNVLVFFTLSPRVAGDELSFSELNVVKYCKKNFISQTRLNNLAVPAFGQNKQQKLRLENLPITS